VEGEKLALPCNNCLPGKGERVLPPTISIVIPLYNKRDYIERCLRSVRAQSFTDYQLVIVNDGSTDGCEKLVEPFLQSGDMVINQANGGHAAARNRGLAAAEGPLLASLDADDEWLPDHLACLHELYVRFPEAGLLSTGVRMKVGGMIQDTVLRGSEPQIIDYFKASTGSPPYILNSSSLAIRREVFEQLGGFMLNEPVGADREYWARIALHWPVALFPQANSIFYLEASGTEKLRQGTSGISGHHLVYGSMEKALAAGEVKPEMRESVLAYAAGDRIAHAINLTSKGRFREASEVLEHETVAAGTGQAWGLRWLRGYVRRGTRLEEESEAAVRRGRLLLYLKEGPSRLLRRLGVPQRRDVVVTTERRIR
jgi:hypothetical protein